MLRTLSPQIYRKDRFCCFIPCKGAYCKHEKGETFEFEVSEDNFNFMESWFEKPEGKELEKSVIHTN